MVVFKNKKIADKAMILRNHGMSPNKNYWHEEVGFNFWGLDRLYRSFT